MERELLHRFYGGTASPEEEREVCRWADTSDENRKAFLEERKLFDLLLLNPPSERVSATWALRKRFSISTALKVAASVAFITLSAFFAHLYMGRTDQGETIVVARLNRIVVPAGQRVNITLADGTNVWLNACSELTYPVSFNNATRQVSLKGEAYFEVAKDTDHPFVVQTPACDIKVLGTKFNVETGDTPRDFSTSLLEGSVELNVRQQNRRTLLHPMQKATLTDQGFAIDSIRSLDDYRWKEGLVCFDDTRFDDLMHRFEKIYDVQVVICNPKLAAHRYSGKCRISDGIDFILQMLQRSTRFSFTRSNDDERVIYIR